MISNFPNERRIHCETGCFVNTMKYYGFDISEEMVFGIGGGIYFMFTPLLQKRGFPYPIWRDRPSQVCRKASRRLGLVLHEKTFGKNVDKAMATLDDLVNLGIPVTTMVNVMYLVYFAQYIPHNYSFNWHTMVVIGKEGDRYVISDSDFRLPNDDYTYMDEENMRNARFVPGLSKTRGRIHYFDKPDPDKYKVFDFRPACRKALREACYHMLDMPRYFGAKGIHYMAETLRGWEGKYPRETIDITLLAYYRLLEKAGTGGSGYRYMYSRFLSQCAEYFQSEVLAASSESLTKAADAWRAFSTHILHYRKNMDVTLAEMADAVEEASRYEYETFHNIRKNFLNKSKRF